MREQPSFRQRLITGCLVAIAVAGASTSVSAHSPAPLALAGRAVDNLESIDCPVAADVVISDSWGDARSGGRRHEGVDIAADRGTPVLAARSGAADFKQTPAGGKSVWLTTSSGDKFFYAHLDAERRESRRHARRGARLRRQHRQRRWTAPPLRDSAIRSGGEPVSVDVCCVCDATMPPEGPGRTPPTRAHSV